MDARVIGVCPVIVKGKDTLDLGWIYYPTLRKRFAKQPVVHETIEGIKTLEDVFYFHTYSSFIEKETNAYDRYFRDYAKTNSERLTEDERVTLECIEGEHDFLLSGSKK
jgi:hypothetical protein